MRLSEYEPSKDYLKSVTCNGSLPRTNQGIWFGIKRRIRNFISGSISKTISYIIVISILSWFGINMKNIATGIVAILHGDISGISIIAESTDFKEIFSEAYQVAIGVDDSWESYKKDKGYDLYQKFVYIGSGASITATPILIKEISEDVEEDCNKTTADGSIQYQNECDNPATIISFDDANDFCNDKYGARIASYEELKSAIGGINPVTDAKISKYRDYPEMTSTLNKDDSDKFMVFYKKIGQKDKLGKMYNTDEKLYIDEDSPISAKVAFRCFIRL